MPTYDLALAMLFVASLKITYFAIINAIAIIPAAEQKNRQHKTPITETG